MTKKTIIIFFTLLFLVFIGAFIYRGFSDKRGGGEDVDITTPRVVKPPNLPERLEGDPSAQVDENIAFNIPQNAPLLLAKTQTINEEGAENIALSLNFSSKITKLDDVYEGTKFAWATNDHYLWITPKKSHISYGMNEFEKVTSSASLSTDQLTEIAFNFLDSKFKIDRNRLISTNITHFNYSTTPGVSFVESNPQTADLHQVDFTFTEAEIEIFTSLSTNPIVYVLILPNGEIYKSEAYIFEQITKSEDNYDLKNLSDVKNTLSDAELISLENDYININDLSGSDIQSLDIRNINLGYFLDTEVITSFSNTLQPIFILEGDVQVRNSSANYAKLYMPAIRSLSR